MKEIRIVDDMLVNYEEFNDGECICISTEYDDEINEILLIRPVAIQLAKKIMELMGEDEE